MEDKNLIGVLRRGLEAELFPKGVTTEQIYMLDRVERVLGQAYRAGYQTAQFSAAGDWSNNACLGYVILGARRLGYTEEQITEIVRSTNQQFDLKTIDEARRTYETSPY